MVRWIAVVAALVTVLLVAFAVVELLAVPVLTRPEAYMAGRGAAALVGIGLLVGDVFIPVPASVVMVAHGALFGLVAGAATSLVGAVGAAAVGYAVGARGGPLLERVVDEHARSRSEHLVDRWGELAILVTRPVPILAETTVILAGVSRLGWGRLLRGAAIGSVPPAVLYAWAGTRPDSAAGGLIVLAVVIGLGFVTWLVGRRWGSAAAPTADRLS